MHYILENSPDSLVSTRFQSVVVSQHKREPARNDTFLFSFLLYGVWSTLYIQIQINRAWGVNLHNTTGLSTLGILNYVLGMLGRGGGGTVKSHLVHPTAIESGPWQHNPRSYGFRLQSDILELYILLPKYQTCTPGIMHVGAAALGRRTRALTEPNTLI